MWCVFNFYFQFLFLLFLLFACNFLAIIKKALAKRNQEFVECLLLIEVSPLALHLNKLQLNLECV